MRWLKKLLRIIAILLPVFCCAFISVGDSHATKYFIDSYFAHGVYTISNNSVKGIAEQPTLYLDSTSDLSFIHDTYMYSSYNSNSGKCEFDSLNRLGYTTGQKQVSFGGYFTLPIRELYSSENRSLQCRTFTSFGGTSDNFTLPYFNNLSVPVADRSDAWPLLPNSWDFNTFSLGAFRPSKYVTSDNFDITRIQGFSLPINFKNYETLNAGTTLDLNFYIKWGYIPSTYTQQGGFSTAFRNSGVISTNFSYVSNNTIHHIITNCSIDSLNLNVYCSIPINENIDPYMYGITLHFGWPSGVAADSVFDYEFDNIGTGFYIITNNDYTPATDSGSFDSLGQNVNSTPMLPPTDTSTDSWFNQLISMFNFNVINPFQSIFNMFQNSNSCSHIPIIAGMLHAESDEYCPWFPSSVRQILTPVISISATMLLFGFLISFLKSSSGNDTVDTGGHGSIFRGRLK